MQAQGPFLGPDPRFKKHCLKGVKLSGTLPFLRHHGGGCIVVQYFSREQSMLVVFPLTQIAKPLKLIRDSECKTELPSITPSQPYQVEWRDLEQHVL